MGTTGTTTVIQIGPPSTHHKGPPALKSYVVTQRRKEFGIRMALGAGKARVSGMVLRQSLRLAAAGAVLGALQPLLRGALIRGHGSRFLQGICRYLRFALMDLINDPAFHTTPSSATAQLPFPSRSSL